MRLTRPVHERPPERNRPRRPHDASLSRDDFISWLRSTACDRARVDDEHAAEWAFALGQVALWLDVARAPGSAEVEPATLRAVCDVCRVEAGRARRDGRRWRARALELAARKIATLS